jgi:hypothetical protein
MADKRDEKDEKNGSKREAKEAPLEDLVIVGQPGDLFNVRSDKGGLGSGGVLTIGGMPVKTTRWDDKHIRGTLPKDAEGAILVDGVNRGVYPTPPPPDQTATATAKTPVHKS